MKVGIPRGLFFNDLSPLFIPFFDSLGIETIVSDETNRSIVELGLEKVKAQYCFPIKVFYGHVANILEKDPDYIFIPAILSTGKKMGNYKYSMTCPWIQTAPDLIKSTFGLENIISPSISFDWGLEFIEKQMTDAVSSMGYIQKNVKRNVREALQEGLRHKAKFDLSLEEKARDILVSIPNDQVSFLVMARPYTSYDMLVNNNIVEKIRDAGFLALPLDFLPMGAIDISGQLPQMYWAQGQKKLSAIDYLNSNPRLFGIDLCYFACGPDSQIMQQMRYRTKKPYLSIEMDEHTGDAGIDTRLHAFFNTVKSYIDRDVKQVGKIYAVKQNLLGSDGKKIFWPPMSDHNFVLSATLHAHGTESEVLPAPKDESMELARNQTFGLICTPYLHTTAAMLEKAREPGFQGDKSAFFQATTKCGPCRLGQYATLESLVFQKLGIDADIVAAGNLGSERNLGLPMLLKTWAGITAIDQLEKMRMHTRPYETTVGDADEKFETHKALLIKYLEDPKTNLTKPGAFIALYRAIPEIECLVRSAQTDFAAIPKSDKGRPVIGVIGEFYVRFHEPANQHVIRKLESKGAEAWLAPITEFFAYSYHIDSVFAKEKYELTKDKAERKEWITKSLFYKVMINYEHKLFSATLPYMEGFEDTPPHEIVRMGNEYIRHYIGGEAILSMGKAMDFAQRNMDGIISVIPFNCMPGLVVAGLIPSIRKRYDNIPFISIEYDGYRDSTRETRIDTFVAQVIERHQNKSI